MNAHMRQNHAAHIEGLYQLAGVVLKKCGTLSPCEFCTKPFQQEHLCPAMVQAAVILLHETPSSADGAGLEDSHQTEASLARSRTRRLVIHDFVTARDAQQGQPICSHCQKKFSTIGGLRVHISLAKCPLFDVTRTQTPVPPNMCLLSHLKAGTLMAWLGEDVHRRLQWTCHCQCCGFTYSGASQLANHLQMVHSELWHAATTCTAFLNAYVHTINRCVCNPSPGTVRPEHQCLILRQLAMQYVRARNAGDFPGLLLPYRITVDELSQFLPHAPIELCTLLSEALLTPQMAALWTSSQLSLLHARCLICGHEAASDQLPSHLQERHGLHLNGARMLQINLAALALHHFQHSDLSNLCPLCTASFDGTTVRHRLVTCPVLHQLAWALGKPCHGGFGCQHERSSSGPDGRLGDVFRHLGPLLDKTSLKVLAPLMNPQDHQPAKRPKGAPQGKGRGKSKGKKPTKDEEVDLQTAVQTLGRLVLRLDLQMRQQNLNCCLICFINNREESILPSLVQATATWKQQAEQGLATKSLRSLLWETIVSGLLQRVQVLSKAKEGDARLTKAKGVESSPAGQFLAVSGVAPPAEEAGDLRQAAASQDGGDVGQPCGLGGKQPGPELSGIISHDEASAFGHQDGRSEGPGSIPLAAPTQPTGGRPLEHPPAAAGQCSVEFDRPSLQAGEPQTELIGIPARLPAQGVEVTGSLERDDMMLLLTQLKLGNEANFCYANATLCCLWWAILSRRDYQPGDWGHSQRTMHAFFSQLDDSPQRLCTWFSDLFSLWDHGTLPADAAEFAYCVLSWMETPCVSHKWGRYNMEENERRQHDLGDVHAPIFLQVPTQSVTSMCLQDLILNWTQEYGMQTGLLAAPEVLLCHADRNGSHPDGTVTKLQFWLHADHVCAMPILQSDGTQVHCDYVPIAMLAHMGDLSSGHYRAALRITAGEGVHALSTHNTVWALTDDHTIPQIYQLPGLPEWLCRNVTLVFLVKLSHAHIIRPMREPNEGWVRLRVLRHQAALRRQAAFSAGTDPIDAVDMTSEASQDHDAPDECVEGMAQPLSGRLHGQLAGTDARDRFYLRCGHMQCCTGAQSATKRHKLPQSVTKCHKVPQSATKCHKVSQSLTKSHKVPQTATNCHKLPQSVTKSHKVPQSATNCHKVPQTALECQNCHKVSQSVTKRHKVSQTATNKLPQSVTKRHKVPQHALSTQNTVWALTDDYTIPQMYQLPGLPEWLCRRQAAAPSQVHSDGPASVDPLADVDMISETSQDHADSTHAAGLSQTLSADDSMASLLRMMQESDKS
eukprot:s1524_g2.t1